MGPLLLPHYDVAFYVQGQQYVRHEEEEEEEPRIPISISLPRSLSLCLSNAFVVCVRPEQRDAAGGGN